MTLVDLNDNSLTGSNNQGVNGGGADLPDFTPGTSPSTATRETAARTSTRRCSA